MASQKTAPKFLNLFIIKLPPGGIASIGHRISGVLMFVFIPFVAWGFARSLHSEESFAEIREWLASPLPRLFMLLLVWSFSHHLLAGIRHLLLDIGVGVDRGPARASAWIVNLGALLATALYLVSLL